MARVRLSALIIHQQLAVQVSISATFVTGLSQTQEYSNCRSELVQREYRVLL